MAVWLRQLLHKLWPKSKEGELRTHAKRARVDYEKLLQDLAREEWDGGNCN